MNDPAPFVFQPNPADLHMTAQSDEEIGQIRARLLRQAVPSVDGAILGLADEDSSIEDMVMLPCFWTSPRYADHVRRLLRFQLEHQGKGHELDFDDNWLADYPTEGSHDMRGVVRLDLRMKSGGDVMDRAFTFTTPDHLEVLEEVIRQERLWLYPERPENMDQIAAGLVLSFGDIDRLLPSAQVIETYQRLGVDGTIGS